mgnify:CR=1 FL=1
MNRKAARYFSLSIGILSIALGIVFPIIDSLFLEFFGNYYPIISVPLIVGGSLSCIGAMVVFKNLMLARGLILFGGIIGLVNILSLFSLLFLRDKNTNRKKSHAYLLVLPVLVSYLMLVIFITELPDRQHIPLNWWGRNGLTLLETLWDVDVFWGEIWFSLLLICLIYAFLVFKFHPSNQNVLSISPRTERKLLLGSGLITLGLLVAMALTWSYSFSILGNWFDTQFAYQLPSWVALIGLLGILFATINIKKRPTKARSNVFGWVLLFLFAGIFFYLTLITYFHPHVLTNVEISLYLIILTTAYPGCLLTLLYERIKAKPDVPINPSKKNLLYFIPILVCGILIIVVIQFVNSATVPLQGNSELFSFGLTWTWPISHMWNWIFIGSSSAFMMFASRAVYRHYHGIGRMLPNQEKNLNREGIKEKARKSNLRRETPAPIIFIRSIASKKTNALVLGALIAISTISPLIVTTVQWSAERKPLLLVNQVGYYPNASKRVVYQSINEADTVPDNATFIVYNNDGTPVFTNLLYKNVTNRYGHNYMVGDFSTVNTSGRYYLTATVNGREVTSPEFEIGDRVYEKAAERALRFFYYQRCNYEVKEIVKGYPGHHACHLNDAEVWDGNNWVYKNLTGGWHDAGDYNKYNSWFQTQFYCAQAMLEGALVNPDDLYSDLPDLYDTSFPDILDEALWGAMYLMHCVNIEGLQGMDKQYMVFETVSGYRHDSEKEARMSYWGPPELDWTTPRRVVFNEANSTFVGWHRGYDIAATLWHVARLIDNYTATYPGIDMPSWFPWNTSYLRTIGDEVYNKYLSLQGGESDDVQSYIGKFYYWEEKGIFDGNNWTEIDSMVEDILPEIGNTESYPLWFGWAGYYMLGNMLTHYITFNRTLPQNVTNKISAVQANHFSLLFDEPFRVKHGKVNFNITDERTNFTKYENIQDPIIRGRINDLIAGENVLFFGAERQTDMMTSAWLQLLCSQANSTTAKPQLVQSYLDWIFGVNPEGLCLMESLGPVNMPLYHHRYSYARNPRGAVPGAIPNGLALIQASREITRAYGVPHDDFTMLILLGDNCTYPTWTANPLLRDGAPSNPAEVWIPHDAMFLRLMTALGRENVLVQ